MKFTLNWLKDYLDTDKSANEIADVLTRIGLEVDDVTETIVPVAAKIVSSEDIPGTHLHKLMVDDGSGKLRDVVCGAPNALAGLVSALAKPGCKVGDIEIKAGKIRGCLSDGMMCSEKELGLGEDHSGIIELDEKIEEIGKPISKLANKINTVFEAGITPNRPDYLAVIGIARDLSAAGIGKFKGLHVKNPAESQKDTNGRGVIIKNESACPVYRFCEIHGIKIASSNDVIANRLLAIGINPKNAPIDVTNYLCYDLGQPMHCFDADEIKGDIIVRNANHGEKFTDLFGETHELLESDLVIADSEGILALAGIVGGARGMTTENTKNIILEAAYFEPVGIRKTRTRLGLNTDSSYRFERGIDPVVSDMAMDFAVNMITEQCGGTIVSHGNSAIELKPVVINYDSNLFKNKTGIDLDSKIQLEILEKLGFSVKETSLIIAPSWRPDIQIPENLVSEVIRIYGYDKIKIIKRVYETVKLSDEVLPVKHLLAMRGFSEGASYGFADSAVEQMIGSKPNVLISNPIVENMNTARNSLIPNLLIAVEENCRRGLSNLSLFELGTVFDGDKPGEQHEQLAIVRSGLAIDKTWAKHGREVDIYDIRADLLALFPGASVQSGDAPKWAHPYRYGKIVSGGQVVAEFGELHPMVAKKLKIKTTVVIGLIESVEKIKISGGDYIKSKRGVLMTSESDLLPITRDFAFIANKSVKSDDIASIALTADPQIIDTNIFDVFDMGGDSHSIAFEVLIQPNKNLNSEELMEIQTKIINSVESKFDAKIRDK